MPGTVICCSFVAEDFALVEHQEQVGLGQCQIAMMQMEEFVPTEGG